MSAYKVMTWASHGQRARDQIGKYLVTNQPPGWDSYERDWPAVAEFPVGIGYADGDQKRRAYEYCKYMNATTQTQPPIGAQHGNPAL